nr:MAG TPA: hypothetical protein [Crassvirales sp.]
MLIFIVLLSLFCTFALEGTNINNTIYYIMTFITS